MKPIEEEPFDEDIAPALFWFKTFGVLFDNLPRRNNQCWTSKQRQKWLKALSGILDLYIAVDDAIDRPSAPAPAQKAGAG